mmetsp:Transcript_37355/g.27561  ORF Transcript_37355/g.27561 Transcript_37355/m.27561 type:complete len:134 (+) Transcript_37355:1285-1686(+)
MKFYSGTLFKHNIINVYFKILEKINLVNQSYFNYQVSQENATTADGFNQYQPYRILYFNTHFWDKLKADNMYNECQNLLQNFYKYDIAILPFYANEEDNQQVSVVVIRVQESLVDLFDRVRPNDNHNLSDDIL